MPCSKRDAPDQTDIQADNRVDGQIIAEWNPNVLHQMPVTLDEDEDTVILRIEGHKGAEAVAFAIACSERVGARGAKRKTMVLKLMMTMTRRRMLGLCFVVEMMQVVDWIEGLVRVVEVPWGVSVQIGCCCGTVWQMKS